MSEANLKSGEASLADNAKQEWVTVTASGAAVYVLLKAQRFTEGDRHVKVHYEGRLISGDVFDSSIARGEPVSFPLNGVIPGWSEGVQLMKIGSKFQFTIPSALMVLLEQDQSHQTQYSCLMLSCWRLIQPTNYGGECMHQRRHQKSPRLMQPFVVRSLDSLALPGACSQFFGCQTDCLPTVMMLVCARKPKCQMPVLDNRLFDFFRQ